MRINIQNFGPIKSAKDICLSRMTVFAGKSSTGKSYLSIVMNSAVNAGLTSNHHKATEKISNVTIDNVEQIVEKMIYDWIDCVRSRWRDQIISFLGYDGTNILSSKDMSVKFISNNEDIVFDLKDSSNDRVSVKFIKELTKEIADVLPRFSLFDRNIFINDIAKPLHKNFIRELYGKNFDLNCVLPSCRGTVMKNYKSITLSSVNNNSASNNHDLFEKMPGHFVEFTKELTNMPKIETGISEIHAINKVYENEILKGKIDVDFSKDGLVSFRYFIPESDYDMPISNVSESVSSLAPLSIFMRYYLEYNSLLLLEDPEINLHPSMQRKICNIMAMLCDAGVSVISTTNSDCFLAQLSNSIRAGEFDNIKNAQRILGKNGQMLNIKDVCVYSFDKQSEKGGTIVEEIKYDRLNGYFPEGNSKNANELYDQTASLINGRSNELQ